MYNCFNLLFSQLHINGLQSSRGCCTPLPRPPKLTPLSFHLTPLSTEHLVLTQKSRCTVDPSPLGTPHCTGHTPVSLQPARFSPTSKVFHLECSSMSPRPLHPCVPLITEIATQWSTLQDSPFWSLISLSSYHDILSRHPAFFSLAFIAT